MKPLIFSHKGEVLDFFQSIGDFLSYIPENSSVDEAAQTWSGNLTYSEAYQKCKTGVNADRKLIEFRDALVRNVCVTRTAKAYWDVSGSSIDMGAHVAGIPECMLSYRDEESRARKGISLLLNVGANSNIHASSLRLMGAAYMALIDCLESSGLYSTRVYATASCIGHGCRSHSVAVRLKNSNESYDPNLLAFAFGAPAFIES
jgi:hypothetical protein